MNAQSKLRLGIDLGGTKIEIVALDRETGAELVRRRVDSPRGDYAATIIAIRDLVAGIETLTGETGSVGIGIPGTISPTIGLVKNANSTWLIGKPFDRDLEQALGRPVRLANDADCFALSEATDGAGQGAATLFGVILGTGVGAGIAVNGRLLSGPNAVAGEWGHNPLPWPQPGDQPAASCYCGKTGCIETYLSGPGLQHWAGLGLGAAQLAESDDPRALAALAVYEERLARALASVINILDPHVIVLGGGLGKMDRLYRNIPKLWGEWVFSDSVATQIKRPVHGDSSGVRGAAWLW